jgi:hypothetical protein
MRRNTGLRPAGAKSYQGTMSTSTLGKWSMPVIPDMWEPYVEGFWNEASLGKKHETLSEN